MKSHSTFNLGILAVLALLSAQATALIVTLEGTKTAVSSGAQLQTSGTYGGPTTLFLSPDISIVVDINDAAPTLTFDTIQIHVPAFSTSNTVTFTTGLGQTTDVTTVINYDPITITANGSQALSLTPTTGGNFTIATPTLAFFPTLALSGNYSVTGPTQSATGSFLTPTLNAGFGVAGFRWNTYNSTGYPNTGQLTGPQMGPTLQRTRWGSFGSILDETVDGAHVTASLGNLQLNAVNFGTINLAASVPEPTSLALFGLGTLWLGARRRRLA